MRLADTRADRYPVPHHRARAARVGDPGSTSTKATLLFASSLTVMSGATIAPALPAMQAHFADVENVGLLIRLVLTLPALPIVIGAPLAGYLGDRSGRTRLLVGAMVLYAVAGSSGLYLDSLGTILIGRALLGAAVAGVMTSATALVADYYTGADRARFMGWQAAFMNVGGVAFLTGGGALAEIGWRLPFLIYLVALPLALVARVSLPEPSRGDGQPSRSQPTTRQAHQRRSGHWRPSMRSRSSA